MPRFTPTSTARLVTLLAWVALACGAAGPTAHAAFPGRDGKLVYSWFSLMESELPPYGSYSESAIRSAEWTIGAPTTLRGCTKQTGRPDVGDCTIGYGQPAVSPNGRLVAFAAGRALALMRIDGRGFRLLPRHSPNDAEPAFSPDGRRLVFSSGGIAVAGQPAPPRDLWTSDLTGGRLRHVVARGSAPSWSTRNWIAFLRADGVYRVRPDGHGLRRLVRMSRCDGVDWSPHGTKLAFTCPTPHSGGRLYVADGDGRHVHRIPVRYVSAQGVAWAPSGKRLLVGAFEGSLVIVDPDGAQVSGGVGGGSGATYVFGAGSADWQPLPR